MEEKNVTKQTLLDAANCVCTQDWARALNKLREDASMASILTWQIDTEDVFAIGGSDVLARLQRNTLALANLLKMAESARENIKEEIHILFEAFDSEEEKSAERRQEILERELQYQKNREQYDRKKAKKRAMEPAE